MDFKEFKEAEKSDSITNTFELPETEDKQITRNLSETDLLSIEGYNLKMIRNSVFRIKFVCPSKKDCYIIEIAYRRPKIKFAEILSSLKPFWNYTIYSSDKKQTYAQGVMTEPEVIDLKDIFDNGENIPKSRLYNLLHYCNYKHKFSCGCQKKMELVNNG